MEPNNESSQVIIEGEGLQDTNQTQFLDTQLPKVVLWTIKYSGGLIKNKDQANYALLGVAVFIFLISLALFFGGGPDVPSNKGQFPYEEDFTPTGRAIMVP